MVQRDDTALLEVRWWKGWIIRDDGRSIARPVAESSKIGLPGDG